MELASQLTRAVEALRRSEPSRALPDLAAAWADPDLVAATDLIDVRARVGSLYASALLELHRVDEADRVCRDTLRLLRGLGDPDGLHAVRELQDRITKAVVEAREMEARLAEASRVAATPLDALLADATTPDQRAGALVRKATALLDVGQLDEGADLAFVALDVARAHGLITWEVFARLSLVRAEVDGARAHLHAAHAAAVAAEEFNLVSAIVRAAATAGLDLPVEQGPHAGRGA
jgi:hypothetical protein